MIENINIIDIINVMVLGVIPALLKLIKDINSLILKIETQKNEIENIKDDLNKLGECLHDLKLKLIK
jgi:hypothetical protein